MLAAVAAIQAVAIISGCLPFANDYVWIYTMRVVLTFDTVLLISAYGSMVYMSLGAVNAVHNIVAILIIPVFVQYFFAALYSVQSNILPIFSNLPSHPVLNMMCKVGIVLPIALLFVMTLGISHAVFWGYDTGADFPLFPATNLADARAAGYTAAAAAGAIIAVFLVAFAIFAARLLFYHYFDWTQMAAEYLALWYPYAFGARESDEDEESMEVREGSTPKDPETDVDPKKADPS
jgi:hypothetical protein